MEKHHSLSAEEVRVLKEYKVGIVPQEFKKNNLYRAHCPSCQGEFQVRGNQLLNGKRPCPYCANRILKEGLNDVATIYPQLLSEWDYAKNPNPPEKEISRSTARFHWVCKENHEWSALLRNRGALGSGCPYCYGRLATVENNLLATQPELVAQFHPTKNPTLDPSKLLPNSEVRVWWLDTTCGHEWETTLATRAALKANCPYCANQKVWDGNSLLAIYPDFAAEFAEDLNGKTANEVLSCSAQRVWWRCEKQHEWEAPVSVRVSQKTGCPRCVRRNTSLIENKIRDLLAESGEYKSVSPSSGATSTPISPKPRKTESVDIVLVKGDSKWVVEYDGSWFHSGREEKDIAKTRILLENGYKVLRLRENSPSIRLGLLPFSAEGLHQLEFDYVSKEIQTDIYDYSSFLNAIHEIISANS